MPIRLEYKIHKEYLEVVFLGKRNDADELTESINAWTEIATKCEENGFEKVLIISKLNRRLKTANAFAFAEAFKTIGWKPNYKLAGVVNDEELFQQHKLLVTFINNFGYECKGFNKIKDAKKWLLSDS